MYQNRPNRHSNIDYSKSGYYFVTIGIWERESVFGVNHFGKIVLNEFGLIAKNNWIAIPEHCSRIHLDEFIIMPDHIHGIIMIKPDPMAISRYADNTENPSNYQPDRIQMYLSKTIQQYKSSVSREIRRIGKPKFRWQRSFYDHVIRDEISLHRIRRYIESNPIRHFTKAA